MNFTFFFVWFGEKVAILEWGRGRRGLGVGRGRGKGGIGHLQVFLGHFQFFGVYQNSPFFFFFGGGGGGGGGRGNVSIRVKTC